MVLSAVSGNSAFDEELSSDGSGMAFQFILDFL
jgi:hypothetical protein